MRTTTYNGVEFVGSKGKIKENKPATQIVDGVVIRNITAEEIDGENEKTGVCYQLFLVFVSCLAMFRNFYLVRKFRRRPENKGKKISRLLFEMGRDRTHYSSFFVDKYSRWNHQAKWGATAWPSLTIFYSYYEKVLPVLRNDLEGWLTKFWVGRMENRQAVTNRKKLVTYLLAREIKKQENPRILSIASGSAEAVIGAIQKCPDKNVQVLLTDVNQEALDNAMKAAREAGLADCFQVRRCSYNRARTIMPKFQPNIVEMVGFLDYLTDRQAKKLFKSIRKHISSEGVFLTCNIIPNPEKIFLDWVLLWPMIYRSVKKMVANINDSGFSKNKTSIYLEPLGIHQVAVLRK